MSDHPEGPDGTPWADRASNAGAEAQRRCGERRRLWDRRVPEERRSRPDRRTRNRRRVIELSHPADRRNRPDRRRSERRHADRRVADGRRLGGRRRATPTPYSAEQVTDVRAQFAAGGTVTCPGCRATSFSLWPGRRRGDRVSRRVVCLGCGRAAVVPHSALAHILVVDHSGSRRDALRAVLAGAGHEVIETDDAAVALKAYHAVPADVVLLAVGATGRLGAADFLRTLRRDDPDARVIAVAEQASHATSDPLALAQGLGAVRTLRMPATPDAVLRTVDEARR